MRRSGAKMEGAPEEEVWTVSLSESVRWVREDAWKAEDELAASGPIETPSDDVELPLLLIDAPLLPTGSYSVAMTDAKLEALYDQLLMSGTRRFVATLAESVDPDEASIPRAAAAELASEDERRRPASVPPTPQEDSPVHLAEVGCVLYLTDVKDAESGRMCEHAVEHERVRLTAVFIRGGLLYCRATVVRDSPQPDETIQDEEPAASTLGAMLARLESFNDSVQDILLALARKQHQQRRRTSKPAAADVLAGRRPPAHERAVLDELRAIAALQKRLDEDVCFREDAIAVLGAREGTGVGSLWHLANSCWVSYLKARASTRVRRVYAEVHDRIFEFLARTGRLPPEFFAAHDHALIVAEQRKARLALSMSELPTELQRDLLRFRRRVVDELEPIFAQHKAAQLLLQATDHHHRCRVFASLLRFEKRRLEARVALRALFLDARSSNDEDDRRGP